MGRPGRDEQAAHDRQDLREGIFARAKTDLDRTRWSRDWPWSRKRCRPRGHRTSSGKSSGKRSAGNPPAPFDEAGTGDVTMGAGLRPKAKGLDKPPDPTVRAPVLDPTDERGVETGHGRDGGTPADERAGQQGKSSREGAPGGLDQSFGFPLPPLKFRTVGFPQYGFKWTVSRDLRRHPGA